MARKKSSHLMKAEPVAPVVLLCGDFIRLVLRKYVVEIDRRSEQVRRFPREVFPESAHVGCTKVEG